MAGYEGYKALTAIDPATKRITAKNGYAMTYDLAGNQTYDCVGIHYCDVENRMTKAVQGSSKNYYFYDAGGKRVRRILNGSQTWGGDEVSLRLRRGACVCLHDRRGCWSIEAAGSAVRVSSFR